MDWSVLAMDWLAAEFETDGQRLAVTLVTLAALAGALVGSRRLTRRLSERTRPLYADVAGAALILSTSIVAIAVVLGVWEQTGTIETAWRDNGLGADTLVLVVVSILVAVTAFIVTRFVKRLIDEVFESAATVTEHQREVTFRLAQVVIYVMAFVTVLGIWVEDLGAIFVGAGFLGIVVGIAAQQTLGALLAGFLLMFSRPFEIGDWVVLDGEYEGIVTDISIVNTRIRTIEDEYVVVPNDVVSSAPITNRSRSGRLRLEVEVGVDYDADVERAVAVATDAVSDMEGIRNPPEPNAVAKSFGDSAVVLGVRFWIPDPKRQRAVRLQSEAIERIADAFATEGIKIPFPQRELSGRPDPGSFPGSGDDATGVTYDESRVRTSDANAGEGE
ncbi:mechanosensitive ion channel family protein [Halovivax limisalsi]|uniref:mechanosensitive ion channel family protein n=1 Tax=Halovivax limisalsi TaxID=1453760 RepID=UPI001FFD4571|nr:mechanosensitive ion channel family protein [Halovivax limisalsi]